MLLIVSDAKIVLIWLLLIVHLPFTLIQISLTSSSEALHQFLLLFRIVVRSGLFSDGSTCVWLHLLFLSLLVLHLANFAVRIFLANFAVRIFLANFAVRIIKKIYLNDFFGIFLTGLKI